MPDSFALTLHHLAVVGGFALAILLVARIFRRNTVPTSSIAWLLSIVFMPYVGVPAYLLFGGRKLRAKADSKQKLTYESVTSSLALAGDSFSARILASCGMPPARHGNRTEFISDGTVAFQKLLTLIDNAEHSIEIQTFIFADDKTGATVAEHLAARARAGVRVRVLIDALGSLSARFRLTRRLKRAGVEVGIFMRMMPLRRRWSANLRNHRKIAIFDNRKVLTGGMNIAEEYMGAESDPNRWIDTCILFEGPVVHDFSHVFAGDWEFATRDASYTEPPIDPTSQGDSRAQVAISGPDVSGDPFSDIIISAIHNARARIWIISPYFVPDEGIARALRIQGRIGSDVRLILPHKSNHWTADMVRNRVLRDLQAAGVKVYLHHHKMLHAKHVIIDDDFLLSGSPNLDLRSLYYNYEIAIFHYSESSLSSMTNWVEGLMADSQKGGVPSPTFARQWAEDICWLVAPLL